MKHIIACCSLLFFIASCGDQQVPTTSLETAPQDRAQLGKLMSGSSIEFKTGRTTFGAYLSRTGEILLNPDEIFCPAEATLELQDGHKIVLTLKEGEPCNRETILQGTLNPGGALKLTAPDWVVEDVTLHTGCTPSGTFPVYHGNFDGERLYATTHLHGLCTGGTFWGPWLGVSEAMGPIHVTLGIDLMVDE